MLKIQQKYLTLKAYLTEGLLPQLCHWKFILLKLEFCHQTKAWKQYVIRVDLLHETPQTTDLYL